MRITYRKEDNKKYWSKRWESIPADIPMENTDVYPLKYSEILINGNKGHILEAGCGNGRILRFYNQRGYKITGLDFIKVAIEKLKKADPSLCADVGDITNLKYSNESFKYVLSFGLYHNLESGLEDALNETYRVLIANGQICASFRADNIQTRFTDWLARRKSRKENL